MSATSTFALHPCDTNEMNPKSRQNLAGFMGLISHPRILLSFKSAQAFGVAQGARLLSQRFCQHLLQPVACEAIQFKSHPVVAETIRKVSFFNKVTAYDILKSEMTISNPGRKKGRGRAVAKKERKNLNQGQIVGVGRENVIWPGLNTHVLEGSDVVEIQKLERDPLFDEKLIELRTKKKSKREKIHPLLRGWSGRSSLGQVFGPPNDDEVFKDFKTILIMSKSFTKMTSKLGRARRCRCIAITGNGNGLLGITRVKGLDKKLTENKACKQSANSLLHFNLQDSHTVNHNFINKYNRTTLVVYKKPKGYGLVCHRAIAECCKLIGIKDIYAKVLGSTNVRFVVKCFLLGLLKQRTYQELADDRKLHLVEFREERNNYPQLLASPAKALTAKEAKREPLLDFEQYIMDGQLHRIKKRKTPAEYSLPSYLTHMKKTEYSRNFKEVILRLIAEHGAIQCYLGDVYPECVRRVSLN